jgi:hypothetical protein
MFMPRILCEIWGAYCGNYEDYDSAEILLMRFKSLVFMYFIYPHVMKSTTYCCDMLFSNDILMPR